MLASTLAFALHSDHALTNRQLSIWILCCQAIFVIFDLGSKRSCTIRLVSGPVQWSDYKIYSDEIILIGSNLKTHNDAASSVIPLTKNFIFWAVVKITIHQIHPLVNRQCDVSCWLVIVILVCLFCSFCPFGLARMPQLSWLNVNKHSQFKNT